VLRASSDKALKWLVKNDGTPFQDYDWKCLTKIGLRKISLASLSAKPCIQPKEIQTNEILVHLESVCMFAFLASHPFLSNMQVFIVYSVSRTSQLSIRMVLDSLIKPT
jgi:hypothetical protein